MTSYWVFYTGFLGAIASVYLVFQVDSPFLQFLFIMWAVGLAIFSVAEINEVRRGRSAKRRR